MPRIDLYWELFHDERNALDVRPLLVDIYKTIISLNVQAISWYASSKFGMFPSTWTWNARIMFGSRKNQTNIGHGPAPPFPLAFTEAY